MQISESTSQSEVSSTYLFEPLPSTVLEDKALKELLAKWYYPFF
jgi:hypothetical protein